MEHPFLDACGFTPPFPEVIELCPADPADLEYLDTFDTRGVQRKNTLHSISLGHFPYGESRLVVFGATVFAQQYPFEGLNSLLVAFNDSIIDTNRGADAEIRQIFTQL